MPKPTFRGTFAGICAVLCWSATALLASATKGANPFLVIAIQASIGFLIIYTRTLIYGEGVRASLSGIPRWFLIAGSLLFCAQEVATIAAFQYAPPLEALLVHYQWPMLVVVLTSIALGHRLRWFHFVAMMFGLAGIVAMLLGNGLDLTAFNFSWGLLWAVFSCVTWSVYSALSARCPDVNTTGLGIFFLSSAALSCLIWLVGFGAPLPPLSKVLVAALAGFVIMPGYILWDYGMKNGNTQLIAITSYFIPVLSALVLVIAGKSEFTVFLGAGLLLVMLGVLVARFGDRIKLR